jgi:hypothetical protein
VARKLIVLVLLFAATACNPVAVPLDDSLYDDYIAVRFVGDRFNQRVWLDVGVHPDPDIPPDLRISARALMRRHWTRGEDRACVAPDGRIGGCWYYPESDTIASWPLDVSPWSRPVMTLWSNELVHISFTCSEPDGQHVPCPQDVVAYVETNDYTTGSRAGSLTVVGEAG